MGKTSKKSCGIGDMVKDAQDKLASLGAVAVVPDEPIELGDAFAEIDWGQVNSKTAAIREQEELRQLEITAGCETATKMTTLLAPMEHWFIAGDQTNVETVRGDPASRPMQMYSRLLQMLKVHFHDGSVEESGGKYRIGATKPHCVIPARLAGLRVLAGLVSPRPGNGDELRGLTEPEIAGIAAKIGAVVEVEATQGQYFSHNRKKFALGRNGDASPQQSDEFGRILSGIHARQLSLDRVARKSRRLSLREQANVKDIEDALTNGGVYLANVPEFNGTVAGNPTHYPAGEMLLNFSGGKVTIGGDGEQIFAEGQKGFASFAEALQRQSAEIPYECIAELLESEVDGPNGLPRKPDIQLWWLVKRHIDWLIEFRQEMEPIRGMSMDGDLTEEAFARGEHGEIVLVLPYFVVGEGEGQRTISPAAVRIMREEIEGRPTLEVEEVCKDLEPAMGHLAGGNKPMPEDNLPGILRKFVRTWQSAFREEHMTDDQEPAEQAAK